MVALRSVFNHAAAFYFKVKKSTEDAITFSVREIHRAGQESMKQVLMFYGDNPKPQVFDVNPPKNKFKISAA